MKVSNRHADKPLVYSCSGCSSAAQMTNAIAIRLDREGLAEMSCIAGVGGDVKSLVNKAKKAAAEGRRIIALDGCHLQRVKHCLDRQAVTAGLHFVLSEFGVRKRYHQDFDAADAERIYETVVENL